MPSEATMENWLRVRVIIAILIKQAISGGYNIVLSKATKDMPPLLFQWMRDVGAVICCLVALTVVTGQAPWRSFPKNRDLGIFVFYGCCNTYFAEYFMVLASDHSYPMLTSIWLNVEPVFVLIISLLVGIEVRKECMQVCWL